MRQALAHNEVVDYQVQRSNDQWSDHRARALVTGALIAWLRPGLVIDPACGDGTIVAYADLWHPISRAIVADIGERNMGHVRDTYPHAGWTYGVGSITETIERAPASDVIVLTEILEHLSDPDAVLRQAATKARYLVASSPEMRPGQLDINPEHLWQFDRSGYRQMLESAGWIIEQYTFLSFPTEYDFGIWVCRAS